MKKVNVELPNKQWGTIKTKYPNNSDLVGYDEPTNDSKNFDTTVSGVITKRSGGINYNPTLLSASPKDQYEAIFNDGVHHLLEVDNGNLRYSSGGGTFSLVTAGYSSLSNFEFAMSQDRVYFDNGIDSPQVYDRTASYGGVSYTAPQTKVMGAQAPVTAPTGAVVAGGSIPVGGHTYKITFLYYDLEESNGGPATGTITTTAGNQTINLSSLPIGGYGVTARKIYRDNTDGVWLLVGTVSNNTATTFSDTASIGTASIPTDHNTPPSFKYIISHLDRTWIAGIPGDPFAVYFSEAGLPNVFPARNRIPCNPSDPITGLYVYNDKPWIFNRNTLGSILGTTSAEFRYSALPTSVGCVDNRSIQVRTTTGIPTMIWLSSKGIYGTNGSSVQYLSDPIEDLVNFNIQQASQVKGQNAQTSQSHFAAGTASPAIDITSSPGTITVANPTTTLDTEAEWVGGSSLVNIATHLGDNSISVPTRFISGVGSGSFYSTQLSGSSVVLPTVAAFTGENHTSEGSPFTRISGNGYQNAQSITIPRNGTITQVAVKFFSTSSGGVAQVRIWSDSGGSPGTLLFDSATINKTGSGYQNLSSTCSVAATAGQTLWIGAVIVNNSGTLSLESRQDTLFSGQTVKQNTSGSWSFVYGSGGGSLLASYTFAYTVQSSSGVWRSDTYDSGADNAVTASFEQSGTYPSGTSCSSLIEGSDDDTFVTVTSTTVVNPSGTAVISLSGKRYWRVTSTLTSTDNSFTPTVNFPDLVFSTTGVWISAAIDHTTDITTLDVLSKINSIPSGASVTIEIATSANDISYSSYTALGSATPQRYSKIKITLVTPTGDYDTPFVSSATLSWSVSANLISSAIDTGNTPAGWDVFQSQYATNGGTVSFFFRTASTSGGLSAATFIAVTNGQFPTNTVLQYAQWKVVITSSANLVPTIDSVTVNWFISVTNSIRVASVFYNRAYYLAAAEYNQTTNNLIIVWDGEGNWRIYRDIYVSTLGYFFNEPYYGSSTVARFIKFLQSTTDQGTNIEMILDTKSIEFEDSDHTKILRKLYLRGHNTGAAYQVSFSLDGGETFHLMIDESTGGTTFTSSSSGTHFYRRFIPNFAIGQPTAGKQILFRIREATAATVSLEGFKAEVWIRNGETFDNADIP